MSKYEQEGTHFMTRQSVVFVLCSDMEIQINRSITMNQDPCENDIARHLDPEIVADALR